MSHTITTDAEGRGTFACTEPAGASCHVWADCMSTDGCETPLDDDGNQTCEHPDVVHPGCIYSEWYEDAHAVECHHLNPVTQEFDVRPPANVTAAVVTFEWDECPLWSFEDESIYAGTEGA